MHIGIDFGTTNSSVAHFDGERLHPVPLDLTNENPLVLPSLIYIDRAHQKKLGTAAANEYLEHETGRRITWERRHVGAIEVVVGGSGSGPVRYMEDVSIITDTAAQGRLLQSIKTALRDPRYEGTNIFDRYYTIDEMIALLLLSMKERAEATLGNRCEQVVLGRPVSFSPDPQISLRAEEILYRAARFAGFEEISFQMEPIAVAHLYHRRQPRRERVLIFDFGGGTLDLTVAEVGGSHPPEVIASHGVLIGGDDLDRRLMISLLKYFGEGTMVEEHRPFPPDYLDLLQSWQTMPELSRPEPLSQIREFQQSSTNPRAMHALETLVTRNIGFRLFRELERVKKQLTTDLLARFDFDYEAVAIHERFLQRDFEKMIQHEQDQVRQSIQTVLQEAHTHPDRIQRVLRTGGSAQVPAFVRQLEDCFSPARVQQLDPLTSVVGGMAIVAQENQGNQPAYAYRYRPILHNLHIASGRPCEPVVLRAHQPAYTDRDYTLVRLPLLVSGLYSLRPADMDFETEADVQLEFDLERPARLYIIYQAKIVLMPEWLREFEVEPETFVEIDSIGGRMQFFVAGKDFPAGHVKLGGCHARGYAGLVFMNYLVAIKPL